MERISRMKPRIIASSAETNMTPMRMMSSSVIGMSKRVSSAFEVLGRSNRRPAESYLNRTPPARQGLADQRPKLLKFQLNWPRAGGGRARIPRPLLYSRTLPRRHPVLLTNGPFKPRRRPAARAGQGGFHAGRYRQPGVPSRRPTAAEAQAHSQLPRERLPG